jgi:Transcriptional regulator
MFNQVERIKASYNSNNFEERAENLAARGQNLTGISVKHLASFRLEGLEKIIDSVGGIELSLEVSQREGYSFELKKGCQLVRGEISLNRMVSRNTEELVGVKKIDKEGKDASEWKKKSGVSDLSRINRQQ